MENALLTEFFECDRKGKGEKERLEFEGKFRLRV
jgi:hypothetical protein